jgi:hypothetical protein
MVSYTVVESRVYTALTIKRVFHEHFDFFDDIGTAQVTQRNCSFVGEIFDHHLRNETIEMCEWRVYLQNGLRVQFTLNHKNLNLGIGGKKLHKHCGQT